MSEILVFIKNLELTGMRYLVCLWFFILQVLNLFECACESSQIGPECTGEAAGAADNA